MATLRGDSRLEEVIAVTRERFVGMVSVLNRARARNEIPSRDRADALHTLGQLLPEAKIPVV